MGESRESPVMLRYAEYGYTVLLSLVCSLPFLMALIINANQLPSGAVHLTAGGLEILIGSGESSASVCQRAGQVLEEFAKSSGVVLLGFWSMQG